MGRFTSIRLNASAERQQPVNDAYAMFSLPNLSTASSRRSIRADICPSVCPKLSSVHLYPRCVCLHQESWAVQSRSNHLCWPIWSLQSLQDQKQQRVSAGLTVPSSSANFCLLLFQTQTSKGKKIKQPLNIMTFDIIEWKNLFTNVRHQHRQNTKYWKKYIFMWT